MNTYIFHSEYINNRLSLYVIKDFSPFVLDINENIDNNFNNYNQHQYIFYNLHREPHLFERRNSEYTLMNIIDGISNNNFNLQNINDFRNNNNYNNILDDLCWINIFGYLNLN